MVIQAKLKHTMDLIWLLWANLMVVYPKDHTLFLIR